MENSDLFTCIDHIAYVCPDAEEAAKHYTEVLGFHELHREVNDEQGVFEIMLAPAKELTPHMTQIQIISPTREDATTAKWLSKNRPGLHHMAWRCEDIEAVSRFCASATWYCSTMSLASAPAARRSTSSTRSRARVC